jgi:hypothetical protein
MLNLFFDSLDQFETHPERISDVRSPGKICLIDAWKPHQMNGKDTWLQHSQKNYYSERRSVAAGLFYDSSRSKPGQQSILNCLKHVALVREPWNELWTKLSNDELRPLWKGTFLNYNAQFVVKNNAVTHNWYGISLRNMKTLMLFFNMFGPDGWFLQCQGSSGNRDMQISFNLKFPKNILNEIGPDRCFLPKQDTPGNWDN